MEININSHTRGNQGAVSMKEHQHVSSITDLYEEELPEDNDDTSIQGGNVDHERFRQVILRPNPNLKRPEPVEQKIVEQSPEVDVYEEKYVVRDLQDLLNEHPQAKVTARLLVKIMFTEQGYSNLIDDAVNDIKNVETSSGKDLNFYSPFVLGQENDGIPGFMRKPLIDIIRHLSSCNTRDHVIHTEEAKFITNITDFLDKEIVKLVYNNFAPDDVVTYLTDDEDLEIEDREFYTASDFVSVNSWNALSFTETGAINVNYTVALNVHALDIYDDPEEKIKHFNRIKKLILKAVTKLECDTLTIALAAVFDNCMLAKPEYRAFIEKFYPRYDPKTKETYSTGFDFITYTDVASFAQEKEDEIITKEEESAQLWSEKDEIYPSNSDSVELMLGSTEFMFINTLVENIDSLKVDEEEI